MSEMREAFEEILSTKDVEGVLLFSMDGGLLFKEFKGAGNPALESLTWGPFQAPLQGVREADLVFDKKRVYYRKTAWGNLLVVMGWYAPIAMVRLSCDLLNAPPDKSEGESKGFRRFFKKKK
jgi:hypothetical protein